jgi:multisubunit Na+/H+ antiporter MnhF subunit
MGKHDRAGLIFHTLVEICLAALLLFLLFFSGMWVMRIIDRPVLMYRCMDCSLVCLVTFLLFAGLSVWYGVSSLIG